MRQDGLWLTAGDTALYCDERSALSGIAPVPRAECLLSAAECCLMGQHSQAQQCVYLPKGGPWPWLFPLCKGDAQLLIRVSAEGNQGGDRERRGVQQCETCQLGHCLGLSRSPSNEFVCKRWPVQHAEHLCIEGESLPSCRVC